MRKENQVESRVGEEIVILKKKSRTSSFENSIQCIVVVDRETPTLLICRKIIGEAGDLEYRLDKGRTKDTPHDIQLAKKVLANRRVEKSKREAELERLANDPREIMLKRLKSAEREFEKLSTDAIKQICDLLDAAAAGA